MTSNITQLAVSKKPSKKCSKDVVVEKNNVTQLNETQDNMVQNLENAFLAARRGKIRAVVATYVKEDGSITFISSGRFRNGEECIKVIGMMDFLQQETRGVLKNFLVDGDEPLDEDEDEDDSA